MPRGRFEGLLMGGIGGSDVHWGLVLGVLACVGLWWLVLACAGLCRLMMASGGLC